MIIKCKECNGKVSTAAKRCPHCGFPVKPENKENTYCAECGCEYNIVNNVNCPECGAINLIKKESMDRINALIEAYANPRPHWSFGGKDLF